MQREGLEKFTRLIVRDDVASVVMDSPEMTQFLASTANARLKSQQYTSDNSLTQTRPVYS